MYKAIKEPEWAFIDCLTTPDKANNCVGAVLYWDGEASTLVRFFDETGYSYCAGPVAKAATSPGLHTWVMARSPSACKRMTEPSTTTH